MDTRIYVMTHKMYTKPEDELYQTLHVGRKISEELGYQGDDSQDSISEKNKTFCELTGMYWIWKNIQCDIVGICHYRRYFVRGGKFISKEYIEKTLEKYDVIVPNSAYTEHKSLREHYEKQHHWKDMEMCRTVITERCPEYADAFDLCMNCNLFSLGNMVITRKELYDAYCQWLFDILFEVEKRIDISEYDTFQARVFGYLSERLFRVWLLHHAYRIREEKVEMADPKDWQKDKKAEEIKYQHTKLAIQDLITLYQTGNYFDFEKTEPLMKEFHGKVPVWVCHWTGEPGLGSCEEICLRSIQNGIDKESMELHVITLNNLLQYVTLPKWIIEHFNAGRITPEHLTHIVMAGVLYRYGGLWLSGNCYMTSCISVKDFNQEGICRAGLDAAFGKPGEVLYRFLLNAYYMYWCTQKKLLDEKVPERLVKIAAEIMPEVARALEKGNGWQPAFYQLSGQLNRKYVSDKFEKLTKDTQIFKLKTKSLEEKNIVGETTYYGYLKKCVK